MKFVVKRHLIGLLALGLLTLGLLGEITRVREQNIEPSALWGVLFRVGLLLAAGWLALPNREEDISWRRLGLAVPVLLVLLIVVRNTRILLVIATLWGAAAALSYLLGPRSKVRFRGKRHR